MCGASSTLNNSGRIMASVVVATYILLIGIHQGDVQKLPSLVIRRIVDTTETRPGSKGEIRRWLP